MVITHKHTTHPLFVHMPRHGRHPVGRTFSVTEVDDEITAHVFPGVFRGALHYVNECS